MKIKPTTRSERLTAERKNFGREAWLEAARTALVEDGTAGVEVNKLAKRLGVSRSGFYWFFKSRQRFLDELVRYWGDASTRLFERVLKPCEANGLKEYLALINLWVDEKEFDPRWDAAVRDWARTSPAVFRVVQDVDNRRIKLIERIFVHLGYKGKNAHIRARIMYYHQVGYYALGVHETRKVRRALIPYYARALTGKARIPSA